MQIKKQDFEQIKAELITLYQMGRKSGDFYVSEECNYLLNKLQQIELENIKSKSALERSRK